MDINEFIKQCAKEDTPIGDLANDMLTDLNFPHTRSDEEILRYLDFQTLMGGTNDVFSEFKKEYLKYQS